MRLYELLAEESIEAAKQARAAIHRATDALVDMRYAGRVIDQHHPLMRGLIISSGSFGYVALYEIESQSLITIHAFRHQRERDYYL